MDTCINCGKPLIARQDYHPAHYDCTEKEIKKLQQQIFAAWVELSTAVSQLEYVNQPVPGYVKVALEALSKKDGE